MSAECRIIILCFKFHFETMYRKKKKASFIHLTLAPYDARVSPSRSVLTDFSSCDFCSNNLPSVEAALLFITYL